MDARRKRTPLKTLKQERIKSLWSHTDLNSSGHYKSFPSTSSRTHVSDVPTSQASPVWPPPSNPLRPLRLRPAPRASGKTLSQRMGPSPPSGGRSSRSAATRKQSRVPWRSKGAPSYVGGTRGGLFPRIGEPGLVRHGRSRVGLGLLAFPPPDLHGPRR